MIDTSHFKTVLEDALAKAADELKAIAVHNEQTDDWEAIPDSAELSEPDENTEADAVEDWNERRATVAVLETDYRNLKRALTKIEQGTYGICEISGEPIEEARLAINPAARTCVAHREEESSLPL